MKAGREAADHSAHRQDAERDEGLCPVHCLPFIEFRTPAFEMVSLIGKKDLPTSVKDMEPSTPCPADYLHGDPGPIQVAMKCALGYFSSKGPCPRFLS